MIRIENLSHRIGAAQVLNDITLTLPRGGVTALIGPNGAGKSTLLSLIARLVPVQTGRITIEGLDVGQTPSPRLAQTLAILPQVSEIAPRLTVAQLVRFGRYPHSKGRPGAACHAKVAETLARFELVDLQDRMLDTLSGGQRQRALIAMAYAQDTACLLLDEPLNNLDISAAQHLMRLLRHMAEVDGKTILTVLHDINMACAYADRIVMMKKGRIAATGASAEVVTRSSLRDVFDTTAEVLMHNGKPVIVG